MGKVACAIPYAVGRQLHQEGPACNHAQGMDIPGNEPAPEAGTTTLTYIVVSPFKPVSNALPA